MWAYGFINRANPILDVTCYGFLKTKREFCWLELLLAMLDFLLVGPDFLRHFLSILVMVLGMESWATGSLKNAWETQRMNMEKVVILAMAAMGFRWIFRDSEDF